MEKIQTINSHLKRAIRLERRRKHLSQSRLAQLLGLPYWKVRKMEIEPVRVPTRDLAKVIHHLGLVREFYAACYGYPLSKS